MGSEGYNDHLITEDTKKKLEVYLERHAALTEEMGAFFEANSDELTIIDSKREDRNEGLDDIKKALRAEVAALDISEVTKVVIGPFTIQKKYTSGYLVEHFVELAQSCGMYDSAVAEGVIQEITQVNGKLAAEWIRKNGLETQFLPAEDGKELTPAVSGPKEMPPLGSEKK